MIFIAPKS